MSRYVLVSALGALGANAKSKTFYTRLKGQLDEAVKRLGFPHCVLLCPPMLKRPNTGRLDEKIGLIVIKGLNIIGLVKIMEANTRFNLVKDNATSGQI